MHTYQQIKDIYLAARELAAADRAEFLTRETKGDAELRAEVESYLAINDKKAIIDRPVALPGFELPSFEALGIGTDGHGPMPERIGKYTVQGVLGRGGMAVVYQGMDPELSRQVAIKLMHAGFSTSEARKRFAKEAKALAKLHHEGIAKILEGGVHAHGGAEQPFIAMDLVRGGKKITTYADEARLTTRERLDLIARVCSAVQHGHLNAIIHRDLKPSNILVDTEGNPKVIDFGVAKAIGPSPAGQTLATEAGQIIGTLGYMSPEQLDGKADVDTRTDVFSLGVVLYEVLVGQPPHDSTGSSLVQAIQIAKKEPERPSSIKPNLRGDIETIILKAIEKDRNRRYQSVAELEEDIQMFLGGKPIRARRATWHYKLGLRMRRNRVASVFAALAVFAVALGLWFSMKSWFAETAARKEAEKKTTEANNARAEAEFEAYIGNLAAADSAIVHNEPGTVRARLDACPRCLRNWEWRWLDARSDNSLAVVGQRTQHDFSGAVVAFGKGVLTLPEGMSTRVLDTDTVRKIVSLHGPRIPMVHGELSPFGDLLVTRGDQTPRVWDVATQRELFALCGHCTDVLYASFSPTGAHILTTSHDTTARIWDAATGRPHKVLEGHGREVQSGAFSPAGDRVVTGAYDNTARIWDVTTGALVAILKGHDDYVNSVAYSPTGDRILTASSDRTARVWDTATRTELRALRGHDLEVTSASFSASGRKIVTSSYDRTVRLWDADTGRALAVLRGSPDTVNPAIFSGSGDRVLADSRDGMTRSWDALSASEPPVFAAHDAKGVEWAAFNSSADRVVTASGHVARVWDTLTSRQLRVLVGHTKTVLCAEYDASGDRIVTASKDHTVRVWSMRTTQEPLTLAGHTGEVWSASFSRLGDRVVSASDDGTARVWTLGGTLARPLVLAGHTSEVRGAAFSPDGSRIATVSTDMTVRIWESYAGTPAVPTFKAHDGRVNTVCFDSTGKRLVTASHDGTSRVWSASTGDLLRELRGHTGAVWSAAFSPDGTRVVTAGWDKTVRVWDTDSGKQLVALRGHDGQVRSAAFSSTQDYGDRIVSASWDMTTRIWDSVPYRDRFPAIENARLETQRLSGGP